MTRWVAIVWLDKIKQRYIHGGDESFDAQRKEALDMAISALREQDATDINVGNKWISVEEQLPDKRMDVLIFTLDCDTYIADYIPSVKQWWVENDLRSDVSHWMPMPEPPTEEEV